MHLYSSASTGCQIRFEAGTVYIGRDLRRNKIMTFFRKLIGYAALAASLMAPVAFG
jgi:hypothetical protein